MQPLRKTQHLRSTAARTGVGPVSVVLAALSVGLVLPSEGLLGPRDAWGQSASPNRQGNSQKSQSKRGKQDKNSEERKLVDLLSKGPTTKTDMRLKEVFNEFVQEAEKLALDYLKNAQKARDDQQKLLEYDKARMVCQQILRLVPSHPKAREILQVINELELQAGQVEVDIAANKTWQDTKIKLLAGRPVQIQTKGQWLLKTEAQVDADGLQVPKELKQFPAGALIGIIFSGNIKEAKPFLVGSGGLFVPEKTGRLYLKMHDLNYRDNEGKITVKVTGTFDSSK